MACAPKCFLCHGQGWVEGEDAEPGCCGMAYGWCGDAGCEGPVPIQVQTQEQCPACTGTGYQDHGLAVMTERKDDE